MLRLKISSVLLLVTLISKATTWDEPWADQVIKGSSTFLFAKIIKSDPKFGVDVEVLKTLSGKKLPTKLKITNFSLLNLCSRSGAGPEFEFGEADSVYFFISQNAKGEYCIATPTTGFSLRQNGLVTATYRHSYHQASVPAQIYELTMTAIFNHYHSIEYDDKPIVEFINKQLSLKPAGINEAEIGTFFLQHVALETTFHLKLDVNEERIIPFLQDSISFHNQVSGARALGAKNTPNAKQALADALADQGKSDFVKVMCIWSLGKMNAKELKPQLTSLLQTAPDEEGGFGGNIMDHRVCTNVPSVKEALQELVKTL